MPNAQQIGQLGDVRVGHIECFKFYEEFQVDFHLKQAGFLENFKIWKEKEKEKMRNRSVIYKVQGNAFGGMKNKLK